MDSSYENITSTCAVAGCLMKREEQQGWLTDSRLCAAISRWRLRLMNNHVLRTCVMCVWACYSFKEFSVNVLGVCNTSWVHILLTQ